jgi:hypothetical protein
MEKALQPILISAGIMVIFIIAFYLKANKEESEHQAFLTQKKLNDAKIILQEQKELEDYNLIKDKIDNLTESNLIAYLNQNIKYFNHWMKMEKKLNPNFKATWWESSKYIIEVHYHTTSDTMCRVLKDKISGKKIKEWCYES